MDEYWQGRCLRYNINIYIFFIFWFQCEGERIMEEIQRFFWPFKLSKLSWLCFIFCFCFRAKISFSKYILYYFMYILCAYSSSLIFSGYKFMLMLYFYTSFSFTFSLKSYSYDYSYGYGTIKVNFLDFSVQLPFLVFWDWKGVFIKSTSWNIIIHYGFVPSSGPEPLHIDIHVTLICKITQ